MKKLIIILILEFFCISSISYSQSKLPQCLGNDYNSHHNCYGKLSLNTDTGTFKYEGEFRNGEFNGEGILFLPDGSKSEGTFINGKQINGKFTFINGDSYVGQFYEGVPHGYGTFIFKDGRKLEGEFNNGKAINGTYTDKNGKKITK